MTPYTIREGLAGFRRAKFATAASTGAMAVALVLIGLFGLLTYEAQQVLTWLRQKVGEVEVFLEDGIPEAQAQALHRRAAALPGVVAATYVSQVQAQEVFQREFGEGADLFLDGSFLPASIRVRVEPAWANPDSLTQLVTEFESWNRVDEVVFNQPLLVKVQQNLRLVTAAGLSLGCIVVLAALFLVANTIRLTIYARRLLIRTMKLVGATDTFIRSPFIVEGVVQGLLAGGAAALVLVVLRRSVAGYLPQLGAPGALATVLLVAGTILLGMLLGWAGSAFAVRRFIRNVALH